MSDGPVGLQTERPACVAQQLIPDHKFYEPIGEFVIWDQVVVIPSLDGTIGVKNG